ncbi:MAG: hypothetical protein ACRCW2_08210 [Cellulosilyticaceae bacterium]
MKKHIYWLISIMLIMITVSAFFLTVLKIMPAILLLELFFFMLILFIANMSSGITYGVIHKNKIGYLVGFAILNTLCIASLIYYGIILAFVIFYTG